MDAWSACVDFKWSSFTDMAIASFAETLYDTWEIPAWIHKHSVLLLSQVEELSLVCLQASSLHPDGWLDPPLLYYLLHSSKPSSFCCSLCLVLSSPPRSPVLSLLLLFWFSLWNVTFGDLDRPSWGFCTLGGISIGSRGLFIRDTSLH